jgi:hypothetical protein
VPHKRLITVTTVVGIGDVPSHLVPLVPGAFVTVRGKVSQDHDGSNPATGCLFPTALQDIKTFRGPDELTPIILAVALG